MLTIPGTDVCRRLHVVLVCALSLMVASADFALSQGGPTQQPATPPAEAGRPTAVPQAPQGEAAVPESAPESGLVDKLGDLIKGSVESMSSTLKGTQQTIQDLNKGTVDTLTRLPVTGFATGRAICTRADNGVPDCRVASEKLCQAKGYKTGSSLEIQTSENCNPRILIPGYQRRPDDCRTDNYVTRAACN